ncbi:MAG: CAP domain-containing protein [Bacilli bacterium]|nr:CAP domain-containing protein [Bacilli bacterium]
MKNSVINLKKKILLVIVIILLIILAVLGVSYIFLDKDTNVKEKEYIDIIEKDNYELDGQDDIIPILDKEDETVSNEDGSETKQNEDDKSEEIIKTETKKDTTTKEEVKKEENSSSPSISKTFVSSKNINEDSVSYKYGVKITTTNTYKVDTYSDGSEDKTKISSKTIYDKTTFNATSNDLKSEASTIASKNKSIYQEVLNHVNNYRSEVGENNLTLDNNLSIAATIRALEMAYTDKFSHTRPDGSNCFTVLDDLGIMVFTSGENIAYGYNNASSVSKGWRDSEGHYKNMIDTNFNKIGVGMAQLDGYKYWVQLFSN